MNGKSVSTVLLFVVLFLAAFVVTVALATVTRHTPDVVEVTVVSAETVAGTGVSTSTSGGVPPVNRYQRLWLTGDVMLSRQVGQFARERGSDFSWRGLRGLFGPEDAILINFEACASALVSFDWGQPMRFPVDPLLLPALASSGVTHVSLANNHGLDCGAADLAYTKAQFRAVDITPFGHPTALNEFSVATTTVGDYRIGIVAFHTLFTKPDEVVLAKLTAALSTSTDIQVAFVHWGVEYDSFAHESQRELARTLAQQGIDLVVGHHPHVVQNAEWLGDTLVMYSLGNLIFDQYFSPEVQEGLLLVLEPEPTPHVRLVPVSSARVRTQPEPLLGQASERFLQELAARSDSSVQAAILQGTVPLVANLATSAKPGMIAP